MTTQADFQYINLLNTIQTEGEIIKTRNAQTKRHFRLPPVVFTSAPIITVRKTAIKKALLEMQWFLSGNSQCPENLQDWWSKQLNPTNHYIGGYSDQFRNFPFEQDPGYLDKFDQLDFLLQEIKEHPSSRRLILTSWNPGEMFYITEINQNPNTPTTCLPGWSYVLTQTGIKTLQDVREGEQIWDGTKFVTIINKFSQGVKEVYKVSTRKGTLFATLDHKVFDGKKILPLRDARRLSLNIFPCEVKELLPEIIMDGLVIADGVSNASSGRKQMFLHIGAADLDYFNSEISYLIGKCNAPTHNQTQFSVVSTITKLPPTWERTVPEKYFYGTAEEKASFLRGYFSGNGFHSNSLGLIATSKTLVEQIQIMLSSLGIATSIHIRPPVLTNWDNGTYVSKQSYCLTVLRQHVKRFLKSIGFIQNYKQSKPTIRENRLTTTTKIQDVTYFSTEEVFDITVDSKEHVFWCNGFTVSNCHNSFTQFFVTEDNKLHMNTVQRSADMLLGVPHNWIQSWAMLVWFAHRTEKEIGTMQWTFGDAHIYQEESHLKCVEELLKYSNILDSFKSYDLEYNPTSLDFLASDFKLPDIEESPLSTIRPNLL